MVVPMLGARGSPGAGRGWCSSHSSGRKASSRGGLGDTEAQKQVET